MKSREKLAKAEWGPGPWQDEPDRLEWRSHGLPCLIIRNTHVTGSWCGYVGVPPTHHLYRVSYDDDRMPNLDVHGGLTYSDKCSEDICHEPLPGEPEDVWWFGFDCAHAGDQSPMLNATTRAAYYALGDGEEWERDHQPFLNHEHYRDLKYVCAEVEKLAAQLASI